MAATVSSAVEAGVPRVSSLGFRWRVVWEGSLVQALLPVGLGAKSSEAPAMRWAEQAAPVAVAAPAVSRKPEIREQPDPVLAGPLETETSPVRPGAALLCYRSEPIQNAVEGVFIPPFDAQPLRPRVCLDPAPEPAATAPAAAPASARAKLELATAPEEVAVPSFAMAGAGPGFWARMRAVKILGILALIGAVGAPVWIFSGPSKSTGSVQASSSADERTKPVAIGSEGWFSKEATDQAGKKRGLTFSLLRPSLDLTDYRLEFTSRIERHAVGWVVRLRDTENYYGMKLVESGGKLTLARFAVIRGEELSRAEVPLAEATGTGSPYRIRVDVKGPRLTTYLGGQLIDTWIDNRIASGGFGFTNDSEERARAESVRFYLFMR
jgi:hypothetical protein